MVELKIFNPPSNHAKKLLGLKNAETARLKDLVDRSGKGELAAMGQIAGLGVSLMQSKSRKMFEVGKAFALAQATVHTANAVTSALAVPPFYVGLALAAVAAAAGLVQIQAIKSTTFGGGGSAPGAVGTFSASPSTGLPDSGTGFEAPAGCALCPLRPPGAHTAQKRP